MTDPETIRRRRLAELLDTASQPPYSDWAWNDGNYSEGQYRDRDVQMARAERRAQKGHD